MSDKKRRPARSGGSPMGQLSPQCEWQKTATTQCSDAAEIETRLPSGLALRVCYLHSLSARKMGGVNR